MSFPWPVVRFSRLAGALAFSLVLSSAFTTGYMLGHTTVGQPKTVIHAVSIQWHQGVSDAEKQKVLEGVKDMAASMPGVKNIWIKTERVEPRGFDDGFAIEFKDRAAADAYALSLAHQNWEHFYLPLRISSISIDLSNP